MRVQELRILELNDIGLRLFEGDTLLLDSPGCAALDGRHLLTGDPAQARQRLDPRRANDRYWYALDCPLTPPLGEARSAADLAHAQLGAMGAALTELPLLLAAPASFSPAQLGVLLGILQALGARAVGLVDSAVAAASTVVVGTGCVHVDVQRHRILLSVLGGEPALGSERMQELKPGMIALQDRCAATVAEVFVRHARFDPLHSATTEQALYDRLPAWMADLAANAQTVLELDTGGRTHRVGLGREALQAVLAERLRVLVQAIHSAAAQAGHAPAASVLLSDRAALLPGLVEMLDDAQVLDVTAVARGAGAHQALICTDSTELPWVNRLPRRVAVQAQATRTAVRVAATPTHALIGHQARALPASGQVQALAAWLPGAPGLLRTEAEGPVLLDAHRSPVRVNGTEAESRQLLRSGDRLTCEGQDLRLIVVLPDRDG